MTTLSLLRESVAYGYSRMQRHWKALAPVSLAYGLTLVLPDLLGFALGKAGDAVLVLGVALAFLNVSFGIGIARMARLLEADARAHWSLLFGYIGYVLPLLGITLAAGVLVMGLWAGLRALLPSHVWTAIEVAGFEWIPLLILFGGAYLYVRASFFAYALAATETRLSTLESLRRSFQATRGWFWFSVLFGLLELAAYALGVATLGIGLIWLIPIAVFASNHAYDRIRASHGLTS